jgi:hypothetical protein
VPLVQFAGGVGTPAVALRRKYVLVVIVLVFILSFMVATTVVPCDTFVVGEGIVQVTVGAAKAAVDIAK